MNRSVSLSVAAVVAVFSAGCLSHRYGDARLQKNSDLVSITADPLSLKSVPLDRAATHTLHVKDLPFVIYPTHARISLTPAEAELKESFPWSPVQLRVELRTPEGRTFFSNQVSFAKAERGRSPGTYHQVEVQVRQPSSRPWRPPEDMPHFTTYDAVVTVIQPSSNPKHSVTLYADTYVR